MSVALLGAAGTASAREGNARQVHVVYEGQRLGSIAKRYNVTIEALCEANGINRRDPIHPGQRLEIPSREELKAALKKDAPTTAAKATPEPAVAAKADKASNDKSAVQKSGADKSAKTPTPPAPARAPAAVNVEAPKLALSKVTPQASAAPVAPALAKQATRTNEATPGKSAFVDEPLLAGSTHRVVSGESLSSIAAKHRTTVKALLQANNLRRDQVIRVGQVLTIPRTFGSGTWWGKFARTPARAGEVEVFAHTHRWKGKLVVNGKVQPAGRAALSRLLGATGSAPPIPERLIQLLAHVSDTFGGRPIRLVSGYRTTSYAKDSRHRHSSAIDFSIPGVPNSALRDYLLELHNVGVGYYPNSTFVHLDVRATPAYWVDYAGPGEAPRKNPRPDNRLAGEGAGTAPKPSTNRRSRNADRS